MSERLTRYKIGDWVLAKTAKDLPRDSAGRFVEVKR